MTNVNEQPNETRRGRVFERASANNVPLKTILVSIFSVVAVYATGKLLYRLRDLLLLLVLGGFIALVLNPIVGTLQQWGLRRRGFAVAVVALFALIFFGGLAFAFGYPLVNGLTHLANNLPTYVQNAEHGKGWIGHELTRYHATAWVSKNSSKLITFAKGLSKPALSLGKGAISMLLTMLTLFIFVILLLIEAPKIRTVTLQMLSPTRAQYAKRIGAVISKSAMGFVLGSFVLSLIAGIVVFITLSLLGVPFALLFALWVLLVDFLPQIGGALAGFPTVLFAFTHSTSAGVVTAIVFVVYTIFQDHVLNPIVMSRAVKVNPLIVFMAILLGASIGSWVSGSFGGLIGVFMAIPIAATVQVIVKEWWEESGIAAKNAN